jgi:hypothetical protein
MLTWCCGRDVQISRAVPQGGSLEGVKLKSVPATYFFRAVPDSPFMVVVVIEGGNVTTLRPTSLVPESLPNRREVFSLDVPRLATTCNRGVPAILNSSIHLPPLAFVYPTLASSSLLGDVNRRSNLSDFLTSALKVRLIVYCIEVT